MFCLKKTKLNAVVVFVLLSSFFEQQQQINPLFMVRKVSFPMYRSISIVEEVKCRISGISIF